MSCTIETTIKCDICGGSSDPNDRHKTASQIRASLKGKGWVSRDGNDFCPKCAQKLKDARREKIPMDDLVSFIARVASGKRRPLYVQRAGRGSRVTK